MEPTGTSSHDGSSKRGENRDPQQTGYDSRCPGRNGNITELSLSQASQLVRTKQISPVELTRGCLARIERLDPKLHAFITITAGSAQKQASQAEAEIQNNGWKGPLHGIPVALKDLLDTAGVRTTAGSGLFKDRLPAEDAEIVRRLKAAGAVFLGKLNLQEFAYGGSSVISYFGPVHNPWDLDYTTGGSSGGSAAAVAAELCYAAIGTDTGGSIRQPAAYCGIVGLKPTYGGVSTTGVIPLSWSLDHAGPMTRTVRDAALVLQVIADDEGADTDSVDPAQWPMGVFSLRLGIPRDYFYDGLDPDIAGAIEAALANLRSMTAGQREIGPLATDNTYSSIMEPYVTLFRAEAYTYHREYISKNPELYQPETLERIQAGAGVTVSQYRAAQQQLEEARKSIAAAFKTVDVLITPTTCVAPFTIAELLSDPETLRKKELLMLRNTRPFNMVGLPTISVPCGFTKKGLPIGLQISGAPGSDRIVLALAHAYEQATEWHNAHPELG